VTLATSQGRRRLALAARVSLISLALVAVAAALAPSFVWNPTSSLPRGLYRLDRRAPIVRGAVVSFAPPPQAVALIAERRYLPPGARLLKIVVGLPGDDVLIDETLFSVNGRTVGAVARHDSAGRPLTPARFSGTLPPGFAAVATPARLSFDSRYFWPVPLSTLTVAVPVWTY
jgi:conjugative transfer signal peptidase TraF